jgi:hypothetical protein
MLRDAGEREPRALRASEKVESGELIGLGSRRTRYAHFENSARCWRCRYVGRVVGTSSRG